APLTTPPATKEEPAPPVNGSKPVVVVFPAVAAVGEAYPPTAAVVTLAMLEANVEELSAVEVVVASAVLVATEDDGLSSAAVEFVRAEVCGAEEEEEEEVPDGEEADLAPLRSMGTP
ncbi:MAG: hypothetical protein M1835_003895, partial [Candelina submexicana]